MVERREVSRRTFRVHGGARVGGQRILLVDDVLTTGATARAAAAALLAAGAAEVAVWVAAWTPPERPESRAPPPLWDPLDRD
jgi:predicted amidophosphoribosyltransferase